MSALETTAKPLLEPMLWGKPVALAVEEQTIIARWATKTAIVVQSLDPPSDARPLVRAQWLIDGTGSAPQTRVALARYTGPHLGTAINMQGYRSTDETVRLSVLASEWVLLRLERLVLQTYLWEAPAETAAQ